MSDFWDKTRPLLIEAGITQADLSRIVNRPKSTISNWYNRDTEPSASESVKIATALNTTVEALVTGETSFDPAEMYVKKDPALRSVVIKLGLHPELVVPVDAYLSGYMDSHGYNQEADKKEA